MQKQANSKRNSDLWKGLVAGVIGGVTASVVMNQFQKIWQKFAEGEQRSHGAQSMQQGSPEHGAGRYLKEHGADDADDDATGRLANFISVAGFDHELTEAEKKKIGTVFHYGFGTSTGAAYGVAAEIFPEITSGAGMPFGAFIWLTADEGVVPLLGLSEDAADYPFSILAYGLASHLVYGLTVEIVRRTTRDML